MDACGRAGGFAASGACCNSASSKVAWNLNASVSRWIVRACPGSTGRLNARVGDTRTASLTMQNADPHLSVAGAKRIFKGRKIQPKPQDPLDLHAGDAGPRGQRNLDRTMRDRPHVCACLETQTLKPCARACMRVAPALQCDNASKTAPTSYRQIIAKRPQASGEINRHASGPSVIRVMAERRLALALALSSRMQVRFI